MTREEAAGTLLATLARHIGREKAISADVLYQKVFGEPGNHDNRKPLRKLVTELRNEGVPIGSTPSRDGGGYYLIAAGSEMDDYLGRIRRRALEELSMEAKLRNLSLRELLGQMRLNLQQRAGSEKHGASG
jgi:hypothetical protein